MCVVFEVSVMIADDDDVLMTLRTWYRVSQFLSQNQTRLSVSLRSSRTARYGNYWIG